VAVSIGQTSNGAKFRCAMPRREYMRDIRCGKFVLPEKWTTVQQNPSRPATHQYPSSCQISSRSAKRCTRKALTILLHLWRPRRTHGSKFTDLGTDVQQGSLKFRPFVAAYTRDTCIYCRTLLISLKAWPTDTILLCCNHYYTVSQKRPTFGLL